MNRRMRTIGRSWAATMVAAMLALSGCGGGAGESREDARTLRLASTTVPTSFALGHYGGGEATLYAAIFDTLLTTENDGTQTPGLAEEWDYNNDRTELTLRIRQGVTFSNGEAVDAAAVAASMEAQRTGPATSTSWISVASIKATDKTTVVVALNKPDAAFLPSLGGIGGLVAAPSSIGSETEATRPIGSGPYTLSLDETRIGDRYVLTKNEDHWAAERYPFERVEWSLIADVSAAANGLQAGQLDHVVGISAQQADKLSREFVTGVDNPTTFGAIWLADRNGKMIPPLADVRVRRAINMAFDREAITTKLDPGVRYGMDQLYKPKGGAYLEELEGYYQFDVNGAKSLLAEAGYPDGFTVTMPSSPASSDVEPMITQSLADIGITVKWEDVALQDIVAKFMGGDYPMFYFPSAWQQHDAIDTSGFLGTFNPFGSSTPELSALLAKANASAKPNAFADVNRYFIENAWFVPLVYSTFHWAHSDRVTYTPPTVWGVSLRPWGLAE